jgi:hypothetical protein
VKRVLTAGVVAASVLLVTAGCGSGHGFLGELHHVTVEVTGTGGPAIDVEAQGVAEPEKNVNLPWKKSAEGEFIPVRVKVTPAKGGTATCRILIDNKEVAKATSNGDAPVECVKEKLDE